MVPRAGERYQNSIDRSGRVSSATNLSGPFPILSLYGSGGSDSERGDNRALLNL